MMLQENGPAYTVIPYPSTFEVQNEATYKKNFEFGSTQVKLDSLKNLTISICNGMKISRDLLMHVIRFLLPVQDKKIKKLLLIFWEVVPKIQSDGKLMSEMILVCDSYRKDLQHPNEYIRGATLRFLCKLKEPQLLEPIMPAIRQCLEHRNAYVRKNAVLSIFTIYQNFDDLIPDAPELIENFLEKEADATCRRNGFMMLINIDQNRALNYLKSCAGSINTFGDVLQLVIIELIYNVCLNQPKELSLLGRFLYELLRSNSFSVRFEAANSLVSLFDTPAAIEAASKTYVSLILKESDNNVRLIVLERLISLFNSSSNERILQDVSLDLLSVLSAGGSDSIIDLEVADRILSLVMDLITPDRVGEAISFLRKEIQRIHKRLVIAWNTKKLSASHRDAVLYHKMIIKAIKTCCERYPDSLNVIVPMLIKSLPSSYSSVALEILEIIRTALFQYPHMKNTIFDELMAIISILPDHKSFRAALWVVSSSITSSKQIERVIDALDQAIGDPFIENDQSEYPKSLDQPLKTGVKHGPSVTITVDGSYSSQSGYSQQVASSQNSRAILAQILTEGDTFVGASIASILSKLFYTHFQECPDTDPSISNMIVAKGVAVLLKIIKVVSSTKFDQTFFQGTDYERIMCVLSMYTSSQSFDREFLKDFISQSNQCFEQFIHGSSQTKTITQNKSPETDSSNSSIGSPLEWKISFDSILLPEKTSKNENLLNKSLLLATGKLNSESYSDDRAKDKVLQLTGLCDAIYAEAYVKIFKFDIHFDVLVVNQTSDTLQNVTLELRSFGDFKNLSKPQPLTLSPLSFSSIKASLRVSSSDCNVIFGNLVYETTSNRGDSFVIVLNEIHIDLTECETPSMCTLEDFHKMWQEFEWENRVTVNVPMDDFNQFISVLCSKTKMSSITSDSSFEEDCIYFVSNLYVKNRFGDEAVANVCMEKDLNLKRLIGLVRIRAKSQSMATTLGQKVSEWIKKI